MSATITGSGSTDSEWPLDQLPPEWLQALLPIGRDKRPFDPATGRRGGLPGVNYVGGRVASPYLLPA